MTLGKLVGMPVSVLDVSDAVVMVEDCVMMVDGSHCEVLVSVPVGSIECGADVTVGVLVMEVSLSSDVSDGSILVVCDAGSTRVVLGSDVVDKAAVETALVDESSSDTASVVADALVDAVLLASDTRASVVTDAEAVASSSLTLVLAVPVKLNAVSEAEPADTDVDRLVSDTETAFVAVSNGLDASVSVAVFDASAKVAGEV